MSLAELKKITDQLPDLERVYLHGIGEPLLNKELFEMVKYAKSFKVRVSISTNLNHFNRSLCSDLVLSGLDEIVVSLDGTSQESVSKYQVGNDFKKVVANIKRLANCKK